MRAFESMVQTERRARPDNQQRLRDLVTAHDTGELEARQGYQPRPA